MTYPITQSYSVVGIINLGLSRIGANPISAYPETTTPQGVIVGTVWPYVLDTVLQAKDWRFAKTRAALTRFQVGIPLADYSPPYGYQNAYSIPADFLRLVRAKYPQSKGLNPVAIPPGYLASFIDITGYSKYYNYDPPVYPPGCAYVVEAYSADGTLILLTDYDDTDQDLIINYIRRETNPSLYPAVFIDALASRLAHEVCLRLTQDKQMKQQMLQDYEITLKSAMAQQESIDFQSEETGSQDWENAGR